VGQERRGSFTSVEDRQKKLFLFIDVFNAIRVKPFRCTDQCKPPAA
jgi:hypothetical protein